MSSKSKRKASSALSKKVRFDVFKRDAFTCQYCGAKPPQVILHVDHVVAVSTGGSNTEDNLITSCDSCNLGKGARPLTEIPRSIADRAAEACEAEAQIKAYQKTLAAAKKRLERDAWDVADELFGKQEHINKDRFRGIKTFVTRLGRSEVIEIAEYAGSSVLNGCSKEARFLIFCKLCWKRIKGEEERKNAS